MHGQQNIKTTILSRDIHGVDPPAITHTLFADRRQLRQFWIQNVLIVGLTLKY